MTNIVYIKPGRDIPNWVRNSPMSMLNGSINFTNLYLVFENCGQEELKVTFIGTIVVDPSSGDGTYYSCLRYDILFNLSEYPNLPRWFKTNNSIVSGCGGDMCIEYAPFGINFSYCLNNSENPDMIIIVFFLSGLIAGSGTRTVDLTNFTIKLNKF